MDPILLLPVVPDTRRVTQGIAAPTRAAQQGHCRRVAGTGKADTRGYPPGAGTGSIFHPRAHSRAGKGRRRGYARGRVNVLPAHTRSAAVPSLGCGLELYRKF
jgi:hypothetical protein